MSIRVSPNEPNPNYHFALQDRNGKTLGMTACDANGKKLDFGDKSLYRQSPVTTTAFKQTSGANGYDIFNIPYSPIVQDDLSGGRGNLDFERDSTKYYESFRAISGKANKAYAGPLEKYATGAHRSVIQNMPGSVDYKKVTGANRYIYKRFQATAMTTSKLWLNLRRVGQPGDMTVELWSDVAGTLDTKLDFMTISSTDAADTLSEWINKTLAETVGSGTYYWIVLYSDETDNDKKHWKVAVKEEAGTSCATETFSTTPTAAGFDLYFRLTDADSEKTCIPFEYKEGQYFVISGTSGAPKLYMAGDRGAAASNAGQLDKLLDGAKSWTVNEHVGWVVMITGGPGLLESQPWRTITANGANSLTVDTPWTIEHTTSTEYAILSPKIKEITGHGLTAPVTDVLVGPTGVVYFCMGDSVNIRRLRAYNDAGTWRDFDDAANCQANETVPAVFMVWKPNAQVYVIGRNADSGNVTVNTSTNIGLVAWGTALLWGTAKQVDNASRRINGMMVHPDSSGNEVTWIFKTDMLYILGSGNPYPAGPDEFKNVRSLYSGKNPIRHDVYLYVPIQRGLVRYYGGTYTDVGPNLGEGLPSNRRGPIVDMVGYPGKFFIAIDAGADGYSSVMDSGGLHERYRAPKGQRIKSIAFQVVQGGALDRLWIYQGNDLVWLPMPSESTNELEDESFEYAPEWSVELSRMHAGMFDVQKIVKFIKIQSDNLEVDSDGRPVCYFEIDYKKDDEEEWTTLTTPISESPTQTADFTGVFGLAGKRLKFRIRGYSRSAYKTAVFLAIIIFAVQRVDVKWFYGPFYFLCEDNEVIGLREVDTTISALQKLDQIKAWGDASNDSLLLMNSVSPLCDGKMVFLNVGDSVQVQFKKLDGNKHTGDAYVVRVTMQDA